MDLLNTIQGFITSLGRFVDREEGLKIAIEAGQVDKSKYYGRILFSEDIFPIQAIRSKTVWDHLKPLYMNRSTIP